MTLMREHMRMVSTIFHISNVITFLCISSSYLHAQMNSRTQSLSVFSSKQNTESRCFTQVV